jgi:hypothetical protein
MILKVPPVSATRTRIATACSKDESSILTESRVQVSVYCFLSFSTRCLASSDYDGQDCHRTAAAAAAVVDPDPVAPTAETNVCERKRTRSLLQLFAFSVFPFVLFVPIIATAQSC